MLTVSGVTVYEFLLSWLTDCLIDLKVPPRILFYIPTVLSYHEWVSNTFKTVHIWRVVKS